MRFFPYLTVPALLLTGCAHQPHEKKPPVPPGWEFNGTCVPEAIDAHGYPSVLRCKDLKGNVAVYKR